MNNAHQLESCNIVLRKPINEDITARKKLGLNRECIKMCGAIISNSDEFTMDDSVKWYERISKHPCKWVIEYKGNCIGVVGLRPYTNDNKAKFSIEIYVNSVYSCGIGTKITKMVLNYAFEILEYHKIYLRGLDYNARAIKCYEKCGFIKEGVD
ncbi:GNAT family N-acetyltransferase [Clostridium sp.]|jgi:ribosomal-protein-alanine N-acetyltransferase|uniref:GNAT family N-acetyltransferase n=1 Tax=Clostridium sp. TaxID=1506 RepID=UPI003EEB2C92